MSASSDVLRINRMLFDRQGLAPPFDDALAHRLDDACRKRDARQIVAAVDAGGRVHSALYLVRDATTTYLLYGGTDPEFRSSGVNSLVVWEAIRRASERSQHFDFLGSMIESVERVNRSFGARQLPYFFVSRSRPHARAALGGSRGVSPGDASAAAAPGAGRWRLGVAGLVIGHSAAVITSSVRIRPDLAAFRTEPVIMAGGVAVGDQPVNPSARLYGNSAAATSGGWSCPTACLMRSGDVLRWPLTSLPAAVGAGASAGLLFGQPSRGASAQRMIAAMKPCVSSAVRIADSASARPGIRKARQAKRRGRPRVASSIAQSSRISTTVAAIIPG